ncbi:MAG: succinate dehydrogenase cytochrome b subunit [Planctomyces sp.]|nr:succinate dehydrogenase cytochrome b subunit [Planctomyces sp.]
MFSLLAALRSSIGKKVVMGLTGLFLCLFLVIHLAGNVLLYFGNLSYNEYAEKLHSMPAFLVTSEVILYTMFLLHLYLAWATSGENNAARGPVGYAVKRTKIYNRILWLQPESMMFFTGAVVLAFTIIHVLDFKFGFGWNDEVRALDPYGRAVTILGTNTRKVIYIVGSLFLGLHVVHGFRSALQSLGINHPKYNALLSRASTAFALIVAIGFASFPVWFSGPELMAPAAESSVVPVEDSPAGTAAP